ncbi:MAG: hypothetical protein H0W22_02185 [Chloroflexi bacterium]|nr:hypothetical protein [Chloroflexota bacterium]
MQHAGRDRYSNLLRTLQAGQELPWQQRPKAGRFVWHPVAGKLLRLILVGILLYAAVTAVLGLWRDQRVDTWVGPDASVMSGQRLDDCPLVGSVRDDTFPNWIRFDGTIYRLTDAVRPMGFEPDAAFPPTGYTLGSMTLFRTIKTPEGQAGTIVLVKLDNVPVGRVYRATPDCS